MKNFILKYWNKLPDTWKVKLISMFNTFVATFISVLATSLLAVDTMDWSAAFWGAIVVLAAREAFKAVVALFVPVRLGGKKGIIKRPE